MEKLLEKNHNKFNVEIASLYDDLLLQADNNFKSGEFTAAAEIYKRLYYLNSDEQFLIFNAACASARASNIEQAFADIYIWLSSNKDGATWKNLDKLIAEKDFIDLQDDERWNELITDYLKDLNQNENSFSWGIYFGILAILFFYNLFTYFSIKDVSFLYYSILILVTFHFEAVRSVLFGNFVMKHFWDLKYILWIQQPFSFFVCLMPIFYILFVKNFLKLKEQMPKINKWLSLVILYFSVVALIFIFSERGPNTLKLAKTNETIVFVTYIFLFNTGILSWKRGYKPARFFVLASVTVTISMIIFLLKQLGIDVYFKIGVFSPDNVGMMCFFALLSFAMGDRINILTKEKEEAQQKALEKLEEVVEERTKEVVEKSKLIEEKNNDILASIHYAKRIQTALITSQKYIQKNLNRLMNGK